MILVDSSVWIDYFNGKRTPRTDWLDSVLGMTPVLMGDLILTEVLQGFQNEREYRTAMDLLQKLPFLALGGKEIALQSAENFRLLRKKGATVRKTIDIVIGTFCIRNNLPLLYEDRDFDPMVRFLGLKTVP